MDDSPSEKTSPSSSLAPPPLLDAKIERVKRFLTFCLSVDYKEESQNPDTFRKQDFFLFVDLARRCFLGRKCEKFDTETAASPPVFSKSNPFDPAFGADAEMSVEVRDAEIQRELLAPARALGVPEMVVLSMLRMFVGSMRRTGGRHGVFWRSRMEWLWKTYGPRVVAEKLLYDRDILFDIVLPPPAGGEKMTHLKRHLLVASLCYERDWFEHLDSPDHFATELCLKRTDSALSAISTLSLTRKQRVRTETKEECQFAVDLADKLRMEAGKPEVKCSHPLMRRMVEIDKDSKRVCSKLKKLFA